MASNFTNEAILILQNPNYQYSTCNNPHAYQFVKFDTIAKRPASIGVY